MSQGPRKRRYFQKENPYYTKTHLNMSKFVYETLKGSAAEKCLPLGRLVQIAIDNELVSDTPFDFDCSWPQSEFIPDAYAEEALRIQLLLVRFPWGIGLDALTLLRHDIGIPNKTKFIYGVRELSMTGRIEFRKSERSVNAFQYPADYEFIFLTKPPNVKPRQKSKDDTIRELQAKLKKAGIAE